MVYNNKQYNNKQKVLEVSHPKIQWAPIMYSYVLQISYGEF